MIFGGAELLLLKPLFAKFVGHHVVTGVAHYAAHAPAHTLAVGAHAAATNVLVSALGAGSALAGVKVIYAGGKAGYAIVKKVREIHTQEELEQILSSKRVSDEEKQEIMVAVATLEALTRAYALFEHQTFRSEDPDELWLEPEGTTRAKTALEAMEGCGETGCDCWDFTFERKPSVTEVSVMEDGAMGVKCQCGHTYGVHGQLTEKTLNSPESYRWIMWRIAEELYPGMMFRDADGAYKTDTSEIKTCERCVCSDFNLDPGAGFVSSYCTCGHRDSAHYYNNNCTWIMGMLVSSLLEDMAESDESD